jgi:hypothetical protein
MVDATGWFGKPEPPKSVAHGRLVAHIPIVEAIELRIQLCSTGSATAPRWLGSAP